MNLIDRAKLIIGGGITLIEWTVSGRVVSKQEAQARADICTGRLNGTRCPMNGPAVPMTEAISKAFKRQVELKNKLDLRVHGEKSLGECAGCLCPLKTKIWLELEFVRPMKDEREKFWENCWLLKNE